ncbi:MAG: pilus assembly protein [Hyphomicrobiales bacterium]|mgnify:CR=1 FL=1|nr:MAG: pilus assembly protein [Hyphomicrobiales bacterium]
MFGVSTTVLAIVVLVTFSVGAIIYALVAPAITGETRGRKRVEKVRKTPGLAAQVAKSDGRQRRRSVQETLKEMEEKQKAQKKKNASPPLALRLRQAGLTWSKPKFFIISAICGVVGFILGLVAGAPLLVAGGIAVVGAFGFPNWLIKFMRKRRQKAFLTEFPNSVDVIVRGVKAGLPLGDCLRIIAQEAKEPVRGEFRRILEAQQMGVPLHEAVGRIYEGMPLQEANFFAIVIAIQQQAGGSLSEALGNLSKVLRDRKKLQGKIIAMSQEAKASAAIIGSLPLIVMLLVFFTTPGYIMTLFTTTTGNLILGGAGMWMLMGVLMMRKMINFDF